MRLEALEGRRVAILGYGREGRSATRLLSDRARPAVLDVFTGEESADAAPSSPAVFHAGLPGADDLSSYDVVIRSPGLSPYRPPLSELPSNGPIVTTGTDIWFAEHPRARTVVITGSKGKSTTAALTAHLLEGAGLRTALGGNIGVPLLDLMEPDPAPDVWVIELSSYQIHGLRARPSIAVVLNLFPEHLDWHGSKERYFADKLSLLKGLGKGLAVLNHGDDELRAAAPAGTDVRWYNHAGGIHCEGEQVCQGERALFSLAAFPLAGLHNRSNLCAALTILDVLGVDPARAAAAMATFQPLPHRLHSLGWRDGVEYVDDSISTTPRATMAALACYPDRHVTVLVGGFDRGLPWDEFIEFIAGRPECRVATFGDLGPRVARMMHVRGLDNLVVEPVSATSSRTLESAMEAAREVTPPGGVVLLSPGAPSFDAFKDFRQRGRAFGCHAGFTTDPDS
jgi:UDP-N-acetylmuramoylalanine--D-glutamate ligase